MGIAVFRRRTGLLSRRGITLHCVEEFGSILDRERARVHRNAREFSLVVFGTGGARQARALHGVLGGRLRSSDQVGWMDDRRIGVVLTDTPIEGAWKFADDIRRSATIDGVSPACWVYSYPSQWLTGGNGYSEEGHGDENASATDMAQVDRTLSQQLHSTPEAGRGSEEFESLLGNGLPAWKRGVDIIGALLGFVLLAPIFSAIMILIKIVSPGPIFFKQRRLGYLRKPFVMWKFRTMDADADTTPHKEHLGELIRTDQPLRKLDEKHDRRIIPMGRFLRASCLDELPQLFNVLLGDMSLIGPRPCLAYEAEDYALWHNERFGSVPGITGLWQVTGKSRTTFNEMMRLDIRYGRLRSFWLDVKILFKTIPAIVAGT